MTPVCPDHPRAMGNTLGRCLACLREVADADHRAGITAVRDEDDAHALPDTTEEDR